MISLCHLVNFHFHLLPRCPPQESHFFLYFDLVIFISFQLGCYLMRRKSLSVIIIDVWFTTFSIALKLLFFFVYLNVSHVENVWTYAAIVTIISFALQICCSIHVTVSSQMSNKTKFPQKTKKPQNKHLNVGRLQLETKQLSKTF